MTETEKAYLAGIIDGEGCIGIHKNHKKVLLRVHVYNTNRVLLEWIQDRFGIIIHDRVRQANWKRQYSCQFNGIAALDLLKTVYPYLVLKKAQARIAFSYGETLQASGLYARLSLRFKEKRLECYKLMKEYNKRGVAIAT